MVDFSSKKAVLPVVPKVMVLLLLFLWLLLVLVRLVLVLVRLLFFFHPIRQHKIARRRQTKSRRSGGEMEEKCRSDTKIHNASGGS